jgi:hypothetical protein
MPQPSSPLGIPVFRSSRRRFLQATALLALGTGASTATRLGAAALLREMPMPDPPPTRGPLRVHPTNPRYFADSRGRAVCLAGAHTWPNLVDQGLTDPPAPFDFDTYLSFLRRYGHNFVRLWTWESTVCDIDEGGRRMRYHARPHPWPRVGPDLALDGKPRFDLDRFDPEYFERLRSRVTAAGKRGIYVSLMLFEGWAMQHAHGAYQGHPFHPENNLQQVQGDRDGDGKGLGIHALANPTTLALQERYVRQVIATVNDLDNVLYEICNECHPASTDWQYHFIRFIRAEEQSRGKVHPIGMTFQYRGGKNQTLFDSPADWISPNPDGGYRDEPPVADGRKVVLNDTDHLWGIGGNEVWAWKSFLRGHHVLFMDPYDGITFGAGAVAKWEPLRRALGQIRVWSERIPIAEMTPQPSLASSGYCLAKLDASKPELLVYQPQPGPVRIDLRSVKSKLRFECFETETGQLVRLPAARPGDWIEWSTPGPAACLLHLHG